MANDEINEKLAEFIEYVEAISEHCINNSIEPKPNNIADVFVQFAFNAISNGNLTIPIQHAIDYMLENNLLDTNKEDFFGNYPIYYAAGSLELTKLLIGMGADVNVDSRDGRTIENAVTYGRRDVVELLIAQNAKIDIVNKDGNNLLHLIAEHHNPKSNRNLIPIAELLIKENIDINAKNKEGKTALDTTNEEDLRKFLLENGAKNSNPFLEKITNFVKAIFSSVKKIFDKVFKKLEIIESKSNSVPKKNESSEIISPDSTPHNKSKNTNTLQK